MRHERKKNTWRDDEDDDDNEDKGSNNYFATPPKRSKPAMRKRKHKKRKATFNPDLVFGAVEDAGVNDDIKASVNEDPATMADPNWYRMMDQAD